MEADRAGAPRARPGDPRHHQRFRGPCRRRGDQHRRWLDRRRQRRAADAAAERVQALGGDDRARPGRPGQDPPRGSDHDHPGRFHAVPPAGRRAGEGRCRLYRQRRRDHPPRDADERQHLQRQAAAAGRRARRRSQLPRAQGHHRRALRPRREAAPGRHRGPGVEARIFDGQQLRDRPLAPLARRAPRGVRILCEGSARRRRRRRHLGGARPAEARRAAVADRHRLAAPDHGRRQDRPRPRARRGAAGLDLWPQDRHRPGSGRAHRGLQRCRHPHGAGRQILCAGDHDRRHAPPRCASARC